jgi:3-oxoacyl-[acyl-carrier-protein] synthase III
MRRRQAHIVGWGKYVPSQVLTNDQLAQMIDTSDEWIRQRTGIVERRIVRNGETTATMSIQAARAALETAGLNPAHLDLIIVATITPDHAFPAMACLVQDALGAPRAAAFDLCAGCSSFIYGLSLAADLVAGGMYETALVVGAKTLSRITDWSDRATCVLFGDGAGAVVLRADGNPGGVLGSDGSGSNLLILPAGGQSHACLSQDDGPTAALHPDEEASGLPLRHSRPTQGDTGDSATGGFRSGRREPAHPPSCTAVVLNSAAWASPTDVRARSKAGQKRALTPSANSYIIQERIEYSAPALGRP